MLPIAYVVGFAAGVAYLMHPYGERIDRLVGSAAMAGTITGALGMHDNAPRIELVPGSKLARQLMRGSMLRPSLLDVCQCRGWKSGAPPRVPDSSPLTARAGKSRQRSRFEERARE